MAARAWTVPATVVRVVDGDSVELVADLGWRISIAVSARLNGINAIERRDPGGPEATAHLTGLLPVGAPVLLTSLGIDKYGGRTDAAILADGVDVARQMVHDGYAAPWDGRGPRPVPPWPIPPDYVPPPGY